MINLTREITITDDEAKYFYDIITTKICNRDIKKVKVNISLDNSKITINNKERNINISQKFLYAIRTKKVNIANLEDFKNFIQKEGGLQDLFIKRFLLN